MKVSIVDERRLLYKDGAHLFALRVGRDGLPGRSGAKGRIRTGDPSFFRAVLYQLSYLGDGAGTI